MIVLGITETHCATAAVLRDGRVIGCASEERFSRLKNDSGYPRQAIDALLRELRISPSEIDLVALAGARAASREWLNRVLHDEAYVKEYYGVAWPSRRRTLRKKVRKWGAKFGLIDASRGKFGISQRERLAFVTEHLGIGAERIASLDHHACHAAAAYWGSGFAGRDALVLTNDNSGDGLCATASTGRGLALDRHEATPSAPGSVGAFYSFVTLALGMKFGEHEYKVMGMAPYAPDTYARRAEAALREVFDLDEGRPARFRWLAPGERYQLLLRAMVGLRFDWVAGGAQRLLEDVLLRWIRLMQQRYGGSRLALGGGVFMNVKANMLIGQEDWVEELFAFPSCGDESNAVGAAYLGYLQECARRGIAAAPHPFGPAYLGQSVTDEEAEVVIRERRLEGQYKVAFHDRIEERIAELLVSDGVVARCAGRMEFGARALGNRSILANPSDHRVVGLINRMIKNRDFWMPFAPTVLAERAGDYLVNPKGLASPYMMLAMATRPDARDALAAAIHPQDATARPQILEREWNPEYHAVISEFQRRTGVGAVLNTSFNLHGEPIVGGAADAVDTFERSGLPHLAVGHWLLSKK
ncbi:MAG TPA: carbamoyltransferase C-terminal domain-containing protein [Candidatus Dormibacteraeota bacterium]|nr:carbamoyltransferase C-terminal domain-containing protein [Candidatus Dormibacteraeota bacterium]